MGQFFRYLAVMFIRLMIVLVVLVGGAYVALMLYLNLTDWPEKLAVNSARELGRKIVIAGPVYMGLNPNSPRVIFSDITVEPGQEDNITLHAENGVMMLHDIYAIFRSRDQIKKLMMTLELNGVSVNNKPAGDAKVHVVYEDKKWRIDPFYIKTDENGGVRGTAHFGEQDFTLQAQAENVDFGRHFDREGHLVRAVVKMRTALPDHEDVEMTVDPLHLRYDGGEFSGKLEMAQKKFQATGVLTDIDYSPLFEDSSVLRDLLPDRLKQALSGKMSGHLQWNFDWEQDKTDMHLDPLEIRMNAGRFTGKTLLLENNRHVLKGVLEDFDYGAFSDDVSGRLTADIDISSTPFVSGNWSGRVVIRAGAGTIKGNALNLWAADLTDALKNAAAGEDTAFSCAAAVFNIDNGIATGPMVLDTANAVIYGRGSIDLLSQSYDLTFYPQPKNAETMTLATPMKVTGPWESPEIAPEPAGMMMKLGGMLLNGSAQATATAPAGKDFCAELLEREKPAAQ